MVDVASTIYFVRHGETDWNVEGRFQGWRDIPLNDTGRVQAEECGILLDRLVARTDDLDYVSSPMLRTRETCEILRKTLGLYADHYRIDDRLRELAFGDWEGFTLDELRRDHDALLKARDSDRWGFVPPSGESYELLGARLTPFLETIARDTVVVSHGGVARALRVLLTDEPRAEALGEEIRQGAIYVFKNRKVTRIGSFDEVADL